MFTGGDEKFHNRQALSGVHSTHTTKWNRYLSLAIAVRTDLS